MWLDSHCHLAASEFDVDRAAVLERATESGVDAFIAIGSGYGIPGNARAVKMAAADPRVYATVGVHPHEAKELDDEGRALLDEDGVMLMQSIFRGQSQILGMVGGHARHQQSDSAGVMNGVGYADVGGQHGPGILSGYPQLGNEQH